MRKLWLVALPAMLVAAGLLFWSRKIPHQFSELDGKLAASVVAPAAAPRIADFAAGGSNRLAILVTDPDSDWIGMVRVMRSRGIPVVVTSDFSEAARHDAIIAYPTISGRALSGDQIRALAAHVHRGGGLLTFDLAGGGLEPLFGVTGQQPDRGRKAINWPGTGTRSAESTPLNAQGMEAQLGSLALTVSDADVLARYDDGSAAMTCHKEVGSACIFGVDLGSYANRAMNLRSEALDKSYVNTLSGGLDRLSDAVKDFYVSNEPQAYLIDTSPAPFQGSLLLTHDLDAQKAVRNSVSLAQQLKARGVTGTFFMQTKYVRDWNDDVFFNREAVSQLKRIASDGMEIGSHGVSHARAFNTFDLGSGDETYPAYQPFVKSETTATGGTVFGELRVSKYLLDSLLGQKTRAFRPGHLRNPATLPQALAATGYAYTSDLTADNVLSNFPFQTTFGRAGSGLEPVWDFPVTIEDEEAPGYVARADRSAKLIEDIAQRGGVATMLVHPDNGPKIKAELALVDRFLGKVWIGSLGQFGDWWRARDTASIDFDGNMVRVKSVAPVKNLRILFPHLSKTVIVNQDQGVQDYALQ